MSGTLNLTGISRNSIVNIGKESTLINENGGLHNSAIINNKGTLIIKGPDTVGTFDNSGSIQVTAPVFSGSNLGFVASTIKLSSGSTLILTNSKLNVGQVADLFDGAINGVFQDISVANSGLRYSFNSQNGLIQALPGRPNAVKSSDTIYSFNKNQTQVVGQLFDDVHIDETGISGEKLGNFRKFYLESFNKEAKESSVPTAFYYWDMSGSNVRADANVQLVEALSEIQASYKTENDVTIVGQKGLAIANQLSPEVHRGMVDYTEQTIRNHVRAGIDSVPISRSGKTQVFASAHTSSAGSETLATNAGYSTEMYGVTTGLRYDIDSRFQIGGLLGADDGSIEGALIDTDAQGLVIGVSGRYLVDEMSKTTLTGTLSYGVYDYDAERNSYGGMETADGIGSDAFELSLGVRTVSYEKDGFRVIPNAALRYLTGSVDSFSETGSGVGLNVDSQDIDSLLLDLSVDFEYTINEQVTLVSNFGYVSDFEDSDNSVTANYAATGATAPSFSVAAPGIDDEAFILGFGAFYDINETIRVGFNYRSEFRMNSQNTNTFGIGASFGF